MGLLETETFELWMSKIMERFDRHDQMLSKLAGKEIKEVKYLDGERLLDNQDLCQLLQASKRSLQRYRSSGTLRYQMLWHKIYYKESDVQEFLKNHFDEFEGCRKVDKSLVGSEMCIRDSGSSCASTVMATCWTTSSPTSSGNAKTPSGSRFTV